MGTSVYRRLDDSFAISNLARQSSALGVGATTWWGKRTYDLNVQLAATRIVGDSAAIEQVQTSPRHYFQRPDRGSTFDPTRTSLTGLGAYARVARDQGSRQWEVAGNMRTPGFDNNDITFFRNADYIWMRANILPLWTKPTTWYRQLLFIGGGQQQYNSEGDLTDRQMQVYGQMQTLNYWNWSSYWIHRPEISDYRLTRGGPVVRRPGRDDWFWSWNTDSRKRVVVNATGQVGCNREGYCNRSLGAQVQVRPSSNVQLSIGPSWSRSASGAQYVQTVTYDSATAFDGHRHEFPAVVDNTLPMAP